MMLCIVACSSVTGWSTYELASSHAYFVCACRTWKPLLECSLVNDQGVWLFFKCTFL